MSTRFGATLLLFLVGLPVARSKADYESFEARVEQLEAELASLRSSVNSGGGAECESCDCDYIQCSGWMIGFETPFLKAYDALGVQGVFGTDMSYDYEITPRIWMGYTAPNGVGFRLRYWDFDHLATAPSSAVTTDSHNIDTYVFDFEVNSWFDLGHSWSALVSGGARYVEFEQTQADRITATGVLNVAQQFASSNLGSTLSAELYYHVNESFSLFGMGRSSVVFGDETETVFVGPLVIVDDQETDNIRYMWETQLGGQWKRSMSRADVFVRAAAEVQYWNNFTGEPGFDGGNAIGFSGFTSAVGFAR